ncbi:MlaE family ABC transporter permease [Pseudothauera rhizosphaerae]|uniref:ABC transporter permease n=1 Tax=Pseudothauera rhizosphaerae TaxID=2565932 RepID=A0A4S4AY19_9RHOO|nr:ABC transporter permease [Pseudothauera rhizosphaerae]THF63502.1 ABC transporter permease [Pseudothauera rhizosphaerae]
MASAAPDHDHEPGADPGFQAGELHFEAPDGVASLRGDWTLRALTPGIAALRRRLATVPSTARWQLGGAGRLDSFGATLLWQAWGRRWPEHIELSDERRQFIEEVAAAAAHPLPMPPRFTVIDAVVLLGAALLNLFSHAGDFVRLLGQLLLDLLRLASRPREWPLLEISANLHKVGVKAMPVTALVGFLIGVVLSYLSALQLKAFGADIFIVNILGLGIIRELGPVLVSVLVAGRSGSAMTAQLGVMRVTEEVDALAAMGISRTIRLVLPKVVALTLAMPLLVLWTSAVALAGGMLSAWVQLDLSFAFFIETLPRVVPLANVYIGLVKGAVFGLLIALVACHFGLRVAPNTESLSTNTTASVVSAITLVILVDAVFAIATRNIGVPI